MRNQIRIIGGKWRGRKIQFAKGSGCRPTHDRVRETVFNWLAPYINGATCLDLFAGSGAFGFEALSRGAAHVTMVDASVDVVKALRQNVIKLNAENIDILHGVVPKRMPQLTVCSYDVIFLDPPFYEGLIPEALHWLEGESVLSKDALIYIEAEAAFDLKTVKLDVVKHKKTGLLQYLLGQVT